MGAKKYHDFRQKCSPVGRSWMDSSWTNRSATQVVESTRESSSNRGSGIGLARFSESTNRALMEADGNTTQTKSTKMRQSPEDKNTG